MGSLFFQAYIDEIYLFYGMAFVVLGVVVHVLPREDMTLGFARHLWLISLFALLHGAHEFLEWAGMHNTAPVAWRDAFMDLVRVLSFMALLEFGRRSLRRPRDSAGAEDADTAVPALWVWGAVAIGVLLVALASSDVWTGMQIGGRYFIGVGGGLLAGAGLLCRWLERRRLDADRVLTVYLLIGALAFIGYGLLSGVLGRADPNFPIWLPTQSEFIAAFGFPVQLARTLAAICLAFALTQIVRRVNTTAQTRLTAALEQAARSNVELEQRVADRTRVVEAMNLQLREEIAERKRAEEALRASEERLKEAQRIAKVGNWELDLATGALNWSDEIYRIFEIDHARFGATYEAFLAGVHPEDREAVNAAYANSLKTHVHYDITHRLLMADGRVKYVQEHCETDCDAAGKPLRSVGTVQDITAIKRAEEMTQRLNAELELRVKQRTAQLEAANRELETFSYSVSHDLKAPLRGIDGYSQLLAEGHADRLDAAGRRYLQNVRKAAQYMGQLIDDLLAYSRLERSDVRAEAVDPHALIDSLLAEFSDDIKARGVAVSVDLACAGTSVSAGRDGLAMAVRNLLGNALKFSRGATHPAIEIAAREAGGACILSVRDNGTGFDMKYHDRIFAVFQRLHRSEDFPGTGVGLAIVKKAMDRIGGRVWAESEPGKGAIFYLEIPKQS